MRPDAERRDEPSELRLEGGMLAIAGGVLIALLIGAFQLGRVVERLRAPARTSSSNPLGDGEQEAVDATEKLTFFDTLSGPGK